MLSKRRLPTNCHNGEKILRTIILKAAAQHIPSGRHRISAEPVSAEILERMRARDDLGSKRHSLQGVELSQRTKSAVQIVSNLSGPAMGARLTVFWGMGPHGSAWLAWLLTKAGDVETNPGPTTLNKRVWICDICHKQIHVRKQISIRCNRMEHWVHLKCAGIRQAQYTNTWTCHLHK